MSQILEKIIGVSLPTNGSSVTIRDTKFKMDDDILRQESLISESQDQLSNLYDFLWKLPDAYDYDNSDKFQKTIFQKMFPGYEKKVETWINNEAKSVLDVGCGAGVAGRAFFNQVFDKITYIGADMSGAIDQAKIDFKNNGIDVGLIQSSIIDLPFDDETFDIVFCPGVLHYTEDMKKSISDLSRLVKKGGKFVTWIYKKQPPIRDFTDSYISKSLSGMTPKEAYDAVIPLTKLGKSLGEIKQKITIPEDIPYLGIQAGEYDLQRFVYYFLLKVFYNPDLTTTRMNIQNFNSYYPQHVLFTDPGNVESYCNNAGLKLEEMNTEGNGISIIATKSR